MKKKSLQPTSKIKENISIVMSTRQIDETYIKHISDKFNNKNDQIICYENNNQFSLSELYNKGLDESVNDIVVFIHDDLFIDTPDVTLKVLELFRKNPQHGIIGLAGTNHLKSGMWWEDRESMFGMVNHEINGEKHLSVYNPQRFNEKVKDVIIVDGLFMMVHKKRIKHRFDESFKGFHFYDIPFCFENFKNNVKVGVTTKIRVTHKSVGMVNEQWAENKKQFEQRYSFILPMYIS